MKCLVYVKFLPGGSIAPAEFFARVNAQWSYVENPQEYQSLKDGKKESSYSSLPKSAICITDYDSIEQLTMDLAIMPGAGISSIEVVPISEGKEPQESFFSTTPINELRE